MQYWLLKTEPSEFSIHDLKRDGKTSWSGVRNFEARNNIRSMKKNDTVILYHSSIAMPIMAGIGKVISDPYPDTFAGVDSKIWSTVDITYKKTFSQPVPRSFLFDRKEFCGSSVVRQGSRLSVVPLTPAQFQSIQKEGSRQISKTTAMIGKLYRHYRTNDIYQIIEIGEHTETKEELVVYKKYSAKGGVSKPTWIRPKNIFEAVVELDGFRKPRFTEVSSKDLQKTK